MLLFCGILDVPYRQERSWSCDQTFELAGSLFYADAKANHAEPHRISEAAH